MGSPAGRLGPAEERPEAAALSLSLLDLHLSGDARFYYPDRAFDLVLRARGWHAGHPVRSNPRLPSLVGAPHTAVSKPSAHGAASPTRYLLMFLYYLVNYFVIVFFNVALVACVRS